MDAETSQQPPSIASLTGECLTLIFRHLPPTTLACCMAVNRHWRDFLRQDDTVWQQQCQDIFEITSPVGLGNQPLPSYRAACAQLHPFCARYGQLALRSLHAWDKVHAWLNVHAPEVVASLRPGATEADLNEVEHQLEVQLPAALRVLYRIHDGQDLEFDRQIDNARPSMGPSVFHGLFGGYQFYSHLVSTRMLPLRRMIRWTQHSRTRLNLPPNDPEVMFAAGFNFNKVINCATDTANVLISHVPALRAGTPPPPMAAQAAAKALQCGYPVLPDPDGVLRWFEHYAEALSSGRFAVEALYDEVPNSRGICLFPRAPPLGAAAVTRGIHVSAAPLFIAELSNITEDEADGDIQYFFAYSVRFKLLSQEEQLSDPNGEAPPFRSVQLLDRQWTIRNAGGAVESEVRGEAVVGQYPLLEAGGTDFTYQSCTHQRDAQGSIEGSFTFIEGSIENPGPRQVKAICPEFRLDMPQVVF